MVANSLSACFGGYNACYFDYDGPITYRNVTSEIGVAPAVNLNLNSVIFISSSYAEKSNELSKVSTYSYNKEWKVTLKDTSKTVDIGTVLRVGQVVWVPYEYTGSGIDQVSVAITSGDISSAEATVLYYGKLADGTTNKSGTVSFTLPENLPDGYKVYVMAEDLNKWKSTDYAY